MVTRRSAKSKGNQFEYEVEFNLKKRFPCIYLTKERGFVLQYDLCSDVEKIAVECKRHKGFSWNQLKKLFAKLQDKAPDGYTCFLIFKGNFQPCLVMHQTNNKLYLEEFEQKFGIPFTKRQTK